MRELSDQCMLCRRKTRIQFLAPLEAIPETETVVASEHMLDVA